MFFPRVCDTHTDRDYCGHSGKCLCIPNTCCREGGELAVTAGAKCPCPVRQWGSRNRASLQLIKKLDPGGMWSCQQTLGIPNIWGRVEWVVFWDWLGKNCNHDQGLVSKPLWSWISLKTTLPSLLCPPCFAYPALPCLPFPLLHFFLEVIFTSLRANILSRPSFFSKLSCVGSFSAFSDFTFLVCQSFYL